MNRVNQAGGRRKPGCALLLLTLWAGIVRAEPDRVAVLDFEVPTAVEGSGRWDWAKDGMADLIQIQLQQQGLDLLDRDLIHSVLREQRLALTGITVPGQLEVAKLLNADYLVTGRVISLGGERFRVEAGVFSVEEIESVAAVAGEGAFPGELSTALETVSEQIVSGLSNRAVSMLKAPPRGVTVPKPEALIMFYRGLDAIANARPDLASRISRRPSPFDR